MILFILRRRYVSHSALGALLSFPRTFLDEHSQGWTFKSTITYSHPHLLLVMLWSFRSVTAYQNALCPVLDPVHPSFPLNPGAKKRRPHGPERSQRGGQAEQREPQRHHQGYHYLHQVEMTSRCTVKMHYFFKWQTKCHNWWPQVQPAPPGRPSQQADQLVLDRWRWESPSRPSGRGDSCQAERALPVRVRWLWGQQDTGIKDQLPAQGSQDWKVDWVFFTVDLYIWAAAVIRFCCCC